jgi:HEAT repeat protein
VLAELKEASASRALADLLTTGTAAERTMTVDTLAACQDSRSSELIATALGGLDPFGRDTDLAMQMLVALRQIGDERAVNTIAALAEASDWRRPRQTLRVKRAAIEALAAVPGAGAGRALRAAATQGDWFARRLARAARRTGD